MSDKGDRWKHDFDLTTPNIPLRKDPPQPPARPPNQGTNRQSQPSPPSASNKFDLTVVNLNDLSKEDENDEGGYSKGSAAQAAQQHVQPHPVKYPAGYQQVQYQPAQQQTTPRHHVPGWAWAVGGSFLTFIFLLIGLAIYLFWSFNQTFTLKILDAPYGSKVFVDEVPVGVPQQGGVILAQGFEPDKPREVRVSHEGYVDWRTTVEGKRGETRVIRVNMTLLPKTESAIPKANDQIEQDLEKFGRARIYGINFDSGSDRITDDSKPPLDRIVSILKKRPGWTLMIEGHTDSTAAPQYNQELSQRRAGAVKSYIQARGIDASRLNTVGYGASRPVAGNDTAVSRALNRRVELIKQ